MTGENRREHDEGAGEPSLASPERPPTGWGSVCGPTVDWRSNQLRWADGARSDREEDAGDEGEPDEDAENTLGWSEGQSLGGHLGSPSEDREEDLGWCANVGQLRLGEGHGDGDSTAPERHGAGFVRCSGDDSEDSHDREAAL